MSLRRDEIVEAVRDVIIGAGEHDIDLHVLLKRVESRLEVSLTPMQEDIVRSCAIRCQMEVENP